MPLAGLAEKDAHVDVLRQMAKFMAPRVLRAATSAGR
jgi:hypothetical protein